MRCWVVGLWKSENKSSGILFTSTAPHFSIYFEYKFDEDELPDRLIDGSSFSSTVILKLFFKQIIIKAFSMVAFHVVFFARNNVSSCTARKQWPSQVSHG